VKYVRMMGCVLFLSGCASLPSPASVIDPCDAVGIKNRSAEELVRDASYIALYEVLSVEKDPETKFRDTQSYTYLLSNVRTVKSRPPTIIKITGIEPLSKIPQVYFSIYDRHSDMDLSAPGKLGISPFIPTNSPNECKPAAQFMIGYNYLVFGGVEFEAAYEPIHSSQHDVWFLNVLALAEQITD